MSRQILGLALLALLFAGIVGVTVWAMGWRAALITWGFAVGITTLFVAGALLAAG